MAWDKDSPMNVGDNPENALEELARRNIFVHAPEFYAPMHPGPEAGKLSLASPFFGGEALMLDTSADLEIGYACYFDDFVLVYTHDHDADVVRFWEPVRVAKKIGNFVHIGRRATILGECRKIGDGAVIMDGAVVNCDIPAWQVWAGNPAVFLHNRHDDGVIQEIKEMWKIPPEEPKLPLEGMAEVYGFERPGENP